MDEAKLSFKNKLLAALLCALVFSVVYNLCAWYAKTLEKVPSFVLGFEENIPFFPWMIVPYMSSSVFFVLVFFWCQSNIQLQVLLKRMLFVTLLAGTCFLIVPLRFSLLKPEVDNPFLNLFFRFLLQFDSPFNQLPSLHIAYAVLFWSVIKVRFRRKVKYALATWLLLLCASTLLVYQHHIIDLVGGLVVVLLSMVVVSFKPTDVKNRNRHVANHYYLFTSLFFLLALLLSHFLGGYSGIFIWFGLNSLVVGYQYQINNPRFLKDENGNISIVKKIIFLPYQLCYKLIWKFFKGRHTDIVEILPQVYCSHRLNVKTIRSLDSNKVWWVYDIAAEMEEHKIWKTTAHYFSYPILDVSVPKTEYLNTIVACIDTQYKKIKNNESILVHCTMGFTRSTIIAILLLRLNSQLSLEEAITVLKTKKPSVVLPEYAINILKYYEFKQTL
ncbi:MAG: dual specificity protein phosphatase family protein [Aestuariibaculum sp.]